MLKEQNIFNQRKQRVLDESTSCIDLDSYANTPIQCESLSIQESESSTTSISLSGACLDEISFEIFNSDSRSQPLFRFNLNACSRHFKSELNLDQDLTNGRYKFNHCSAFEYRKKKYSVGFRVVGDSHKEAGLVFDILKIFRTLRPEKWYYQAFDKLKDNFAKNKKKLSFFIKKSLAIKDESFGLKEFAEICKFVHTVKDEKNRLGSTSSSQEVFIDDVENFCFDNVEEFKKPSDTFEEKAREFRRKSYLKRRDNVHNVFESFFELKLFFAWITSYQMRLKQMEFEFLFFEEYLELLRTFQK